jgi:hypothetical protein
MTAFAGYRGLDTLFKAHETHKMAAIASPRGVDQLIVLRKAFAVPILVRMIGLPPLKLDIPLVIADDIVLGAIEIVSKHVALFEFPADGVRDIFERKIGIGWERHKIAYDSFWRFLDGLNHFGVERHAPRLVLFDVAFRARLRPPVLGGFLSLGLKIHGGAQTRLGELPVIWKNLLRLHEEIAAANPTRYDPKQDYSQYNQFSVHMLCPFIDSSGAIGIRAANASVPSRLSRSTRYPG